MLWMLCCQIHRTMALLTMLCSVHQIHPIRKHWKWALLRLEKKLSKQSECHDQQVLSLHTWCRTKPSKSTTESRSLSSRCSESSGCCRLCTEAKLWSWSWRRVCAESGSSKSWSSRRLTKTLTKWFCFRLNRTQILDLKFSLTSRRTECWSRLNGTECRSWCACPKGRSCCGGTKSWCPCGGTKCWSPCVGPKCWSRCIGTKCWSRRGTKCWSRCISTECRSRCISTECWRCWICTKRGCCCVPTKWKISESSCWNEEFRLIKFEARDECATRDYVLQAYCLWDQYFRS